MKIVYRFLLVFAALLFTKGPVMAESNAPKNEGADRQRVELHSSRGAVRLQVDKKLVLSAPSSDLHSLILGVEFPSKAPAKKGQKIAGTNMVKMWVSPQPGDRPLETDAERLLKRMGASKELKIGATAIERLPAPDREIQCFLRTSFGVSATTSEEICIFRLVDEKVASVSHYIGSGTKEGVIKIDDRLIVKFNYSANLNVAPMEMCAWVKEMIIGLIEN